MTSDFSNVYDDATRAAAYAGLQFPGTYYLAFRDLPDILTRHVRGTSALDFGCGAGRSTRFLQERGFRSLGVDISAPMLARAQERDPDSAYRLVRDGDLSAVAGESFDLIFAAFTFDNVPTDRKHGLFAALRHLLAPDGRLINLVSAPEIYLHEWASFSTKDFPTNRSARTGDTVLIEMRDVDDRRPVRDILCTDEDYREIYRGAGLEVIDVHRPLGYANEKHAWVSELTISPWAIYVLRSQVDANTSLPH